MTGRSAEAWAGGQNDLPQMPNPDSAPCGQIAILSVPPPSEASAPLPVQPPSPALPVRAAEPVKPWGVELAGGSTRAMALANYSELQRKYSAGSILAGREPHLVILGRVGEMASVRVRIGADTREEGIKLCKTLSARGWFCDVLRSPQR